MENMRDVMLFLVNSVVYMLQSASWTVFTPDEVLKELNANNYGPLCGYSIIYYHKDESTTEINLIPALKGKKKYIILQSEDCTEWYEYVRKKEHNVFLQIHNRIAVLAKLPEERR